MLLKEGLRGGVLVTVGRPDARLWRCWCKVCGYGGDGAVS